MFHNKFELSNWSAVQWSTSGKTDSAKTVKHRDSTTHNQEGPSLTTAWSFVSLTRDSEDNFLKKKIDI